MPTCTQCGEQNPVGTSRCNKCGVTLAGQARIRADAKRGAASSAVSLVMRIAVIAVVLLLAYPAYRFAGTTYFQYRLNTVKEAAAKACKDSSNQRDQIDQCLATDDNLIKAQTDFDNFTKGGKK